MRRLSWLAAAAVMLALAAVSVVYALAGVAGSSPTASEPVQVAQGPGGPGGPGGGPPPMMSEADRAKMREQMMARMLDQAGLTDNEKAAAKKAMAAKEKARQTLANELEKLRAVAQQDNPTDAELTDALALYPPALADYRKAVEAADQALIKLLSVKAQVRCLSLGILDNGLGGFGQPGGLGPPPGPQPGPPPRT
jgi:tetratricopeptide (TPR) repeat protein